MDCPSLKTLPSNIYLCSSLRDLRISSAGGMDKLPYTLRRMTLSNIVFGGRVTSVATFLDEMRRGNHLSSYPWEDVS